MTKAAEAAHYLKPLDCFYFYPVWGERGPGTEDSGHAGNNKHEKKQLSEVPKSLWGSGQVSLTKLCALRTKGKAFSSGVSPLCLSQESKLQNFYLSKHLLFCDCIKYIDLDLREENYIYMYLHTHTQISIFHIYFLYV